MFQVQYSGSSQIGLFGSDFAFSFGFPSLSLDFKTDIFIDEPAVEFEYCAIHDHTWVCL